MFTLLFFDDWYLHQRTNLTRHVGRPSLLPEATLEDPYVDPAWGYPTVFQEPRSGTWRCLYQGQIANGRFMPVVAESRDGVRWELPDLTERVRIADRLVPHQLFDIERFGEWNGPYLDPSAVGTDQWLKGLVVARRAAGLGLESHLMTSPGGINWRYTEGPGVASAGGRSDLVCVLEPIPAEPRDRDAADPQ